MVDYESEKNIAKIDIPIFLVIKIHIRPTRFLENRASNTKYDLKKRLCKQFKSIDWGNNQKIEKAIAIAKDNKDNAEDFWKKNRKVKKEKTS